MSEKMKDWTEKLEREEQETESDQEASQDESSDTAISLDHPENRIAILERKERLLAKIQTSNRKTRELELVFLAAKSEAKAAKDLWETSVLALQRLIESARDGQQLLPGIEDLDTNDATQFSAEFVPGADGQQDAGESRDASDEAWRDVAMESIGVKGKLLERLVEADLSMLGTWSDWHGQGHNREKIAGIGEGAITKVADLCEAYWAAVHNEGNNP
jgi:hypothetical protein